MKYLAVGVAAVLSLALTACDPPMPPDVRAAQAEKTHVCIPGAVSLQTPPLLSDVANTLSTSLTASCAETSLDVVATKPQLAIGDSAYADCSPSLTVPFAIDAGVVAYSVGGISTLTLAPATIAGIFNGTIVDWSDPLIAADNPDQTFESTPIKVRKEVSTVAFGAFNSWMTRLRAPIDPAGLSVIPTLTKYTDLLEGEIAIMPNSVVVSKSQTPAIIATKGQETVADNQAIIEASSQWKAVASPLGVTVELDPEATPIVPSGFEPVPTYQAIYPVDMSVCGATSKLVQSVGYFLLRQDSQGALASSNYNPLAENVRIAALQVMGKGLPAGK
jgi:hypothetical protein